MGLEHRSLSDTLLLEYHSLGLYEQNYRYICQKMQDPEHSQADLKIFTGAEHAMNMV